MPEDLPDNYEGCECLYYGEVPRGVGICDLGKPTECPHTDFFSRKRNCPDFVDINPSKDDRCRFNLFTGKADLYSAREYLCIPAEHAPEMSKYKQSFVKTINNGAQWLIPPCDCEGLLEIPSAFKLRIPQSMVNELKPLLEENKNA